MNFSDVHDDFFKVLKPDFPNLTAGQLKLVAYIKMNLSSKEIPQLLNISLRAAGNKRYKLRKSLGLKHGDNLTEFIIANY